MRRTFLLLGLITLAICGALLALASLTDAVSAETLWPEAMKALVSILAVAVIGGVVKLLLDLHVRERDARQAEDEFLREMIAEIENIVSGIERARFMISAHRSATSYRDRMQDLIELRVRTDAVKRRVQTHWPRPRDDKALVRSRTWTRDVKRRAQDHWPRSLEQRRADVVALVQERAGAMSGYLSGLSGEFELRYKSVADQERIDEAVVAEEIRRHAHPPDRPGVQGTGGRPVLTWTAWARLTDPRDFPWLVDLICGEKGSRYLGDIRPGCEKVVRALMDLLWFGGARR
jgi:hypothetical protein